MSSRYDEGFTEGVEGERGRIRAAFKKRCTAPLDRFGREGMHCGLNRGHIGGCSQLTDTVSITRERLEDILNG